MCGPGVPVRGAETPEKWPSWIPLTCGVTGVCYECAYVHAHTHPSVHAGSCARLTQASPDPPARDAPACPARSRTGALCERIRAPKRARQRLPTAEGGRPGLIRPPRSADSCLVHVAARRRPQSTWKCAWRACHIRKSRDCAAPEDLPPPLCRGGGGLPRANRRAAVHREGSQSASTEAIGP